MFIFFWGGGILNSPTQMKRFCWWRIMINNNNSICLSADHILTLYYLHFLHIYKHYWYKQTYFSPVSQCTMNKFCSWSVLSNILYRLQPYIIPNDMSLDWFVCACGCMRTCRVCSCWNRGFSFYLENFFFVWIQV